jgi:hypothetical protein
VWDTPWKKRPRPNDIESDDSDFDDLKSVIGLKGAYRKTDNAASLKQAGSYAHSQRTAQTRRTGASGAASKAGRSSKGGSDTAARFKAKRAGGDTAGDSKVEPFAYWRLDKNLLNPRNQKQRAAKSKLGRVVASDTPARGSKAKAKQRRLQLEQE